MGDYFPAFVAHIAPGKVDKILQNQTFNRLKQSADPLPDLYQFSSLKIKKFLIKIDGFMAFFQSLPSLLPISDRTGIYPFPNPLTCKI